jgi:hypothetical protein
VEPGEDRDPKGGTVAIEVVSHPSSLSDWNPAKQPYYLELIGETRPLLNEAYAQFQPAGDPDAAGKTLRAAPVYEYWWTIGHAGVGAHHGALHRWLQGSGGLWDELDDPAAHVGMYFSVGSGYRIRELVATVKYLSPVDKQDTAWNKLAEDWKQLQPVIDSASSVAMALGTIAGGPVGGAVGGAASTAASWLDTIAKLKVNSVPQSDEFHWSVIKVTARHHDAVIDGVLWNLPRSMFTELGGRITGSLALSFVPVGQQTADAAEDLPTPDLGSVYCQASVRGGGEAFTAPDDDAGFIELKIRPELPAAPKPAAENS